MSVYLDGGLKVRVTATYVNHDEWQSPVGVDDFENWQDTYGTIIEGDVTDIGGGKMSAALTILRAGSYSLDVTVDGEHV